MLKLRQIRRSKVRYLVLGCGKNSMGEAIAKRLLCENDAIVFVADQNPENEEHTLEKLRNRPTGKDSRILRFGSAGAGLDVVKYQDILPKLIETFHVVVSALPASLNPLVAEAVLKANESAQKWKTLRTHYCDLGGVLDITKKILSPVNMKRALRCGASIVPECGFQPGAGNVHAMELYEKYFGSGITWIRAVIDSLTIYVGGLPHISPHYKELFNFRGLEEIYYNKPLVLSNGKPRKLKPLAHYERMNSLRFGLCFGEHEGIKMEAAVTGGLGMLPKYMKNTVMCLEEKTLRYEGHYDVIKKTPRENFTPVIKEIVSKCPEKAEDYCLMQIEAVGYGKTDGKKIKVVRTLFTESDADLNSMQKATGYPTAVIAKMLAEGRAKPGACPPEIALNPEETVAALTRELPVIAEYKTFLE